MAIYKGTVGLILYIECGETITGATGITLFVTKPHGKKEQWTGATVEGTTQLVYTTGVGDLDVDGFYTVYPQLTVEGWRGFGNPARFLVKDAENPDRTYNI